MRKKRATIYDVAEKAGVSGALVSMVLNKAAGKVPVAAATERRIRQAAKALHYKPSPQARALRLGRSHIIGVVVHSLMASRGLVIILGKLTTELRKKGYQAFLWTAAGGGNAEDLIRFAQDQRVDGMILVSPYESAQERKLAEAVIGTMPVKVIGNRESDGHDPSYFPFPHQKALEDTLERFSNSGVVKHCVLLYAQRFGWQHDFLCAFQRHERSRTRMNLQVLRTNSMNAMDDIMKLLGKYRRRCAPFVVIVPGIAPAVRLVSHVRDRGWNVPEEVGVLGIGLDDFSCELCVPKLSALHFDTDIVVQNVVGALIADMEGQPADPRDTGGAPYWLQVRGTLPKGIKG